MRRLRKFLEPSAKPKVVFSDNLLEFGKACEELSWNHCTSTPHLSETNGIPERAARTIEEGTSAVLLQSGLDEKWWADSMECYCYLRKFQDLLSDGKTPYERRFVKPFVGPTIPFGSLVEYYPISAKDQSSNFCEGMGGVQGALTLFCGGVAQTCHDDRVVELKEQLVVEEVDGEGQEGKEKEEGRGQCDCSELEPK